MFAWGLGTHTKQSELLLDSSRQEYDHSDLCKKIRKYKDDVQMSMFLSDYIDRSLTYCELHHDQNTTTFLREICASFAFAFQTPEAGRLTYLREAVDKVKHKMKTKTMIDRAKSLRDTTDGVMWFELRVLCMDVYCTAKIMSMDSEWIIFYGGRKHAEGIFSFLKENGYTEHDVEHVSKFLKDTRQNLPYVKNLVSPSTETLQSSKQKPKAKQCITLLGENHMYTPQAFSTYMLDFLQHSCKSGRKNIVVLIEKHPTNEKDTLQRELTCNMPQIAIQKIRCHPITTRKCEGIEIIPVDNRHKDMEFLRIEFLCLSKVPHLKAYADAFQRHAQLDFLNYLNRIEC
jgi:hypothetical protein